MIFYYTLVDVDEDKSIIFQISASDENEALKKLFKKMFPYLITNAHVSLLDINTMIDPMAYRMYEVKEQPVLI